METSSRLIVIVPALFGADIGGIVYRTIHLPYFQSRGHNSMELVVFPKLAYNSKEAPEQTTESTTAPSWFPLSTTLVEAWQTMLPGTGHRLEDREYV
ncbi:uncharacterized protein EI97DRAFT_309025 [Westerdykella ornata]|uniref:Uncharacterized protein n=1 Tax=Westerdykella ornata TaxID=318751 RepID=A0A6A6JLI5_WESOR|nr:uncharacterized protein EI97DRAFT_309025 [Westerdykella ornata]KAF2277095.1 hypothetical protein EI97DRAFT_309025 [Westerdykella ornata]